MLPKSRSRAEDTDNAAPFKEQRNNLGMRKRTSKGMSWNIKAWNGAGQRGQNQTTPNLSGMVQEVVSRLGWKEGNNIVFLLYTGQGNGVRRAVSADSSAATAPVLHIVYKNQKFRERK